MGLLDLARLPHGLWSGTGGSSSSSDQSDDSFHNNVAKFAINPAICHENHDDRCEISSSSSSSSSNTSDADSKCRDRASSNKCQTSAARSNCNNKTKLLNDLNTVTQRLTSGKGDAEAETSRYPGDTAEHLSLRQDRANATSLSSSSLENRTEQTLANNLHQSKEETLEARNELRQQRNEKFASIIGSELQNSRISSEDSIIETRGEGGGSESESDSDKMVMINMEQFEKNYQLFVDKFDAIVDQDQFKGEEVNKLAGDFYQQHKDFMQTIPYGSMPNSTYPNCSSSVATEEDFKLVSSPDGGFKAGRESQIVGDVYRRIARATYLYQTLLISRNPKESLNRHEPIDFARYAIRHDSHNVEAVLELAKGLGWYLDKVGNGLEKVRLGRLFYYAVMRAIDLDNKQALAHHMIGRYYFNVSQLSWLERTLASKLFTPAEMAYTIEDSEKAFRLAHAIDSTISPTGLWMAKCLQAQKKPKEQITEWVELGVKTKSREPWNDLEREELEALKRKGKY